MNNRRTGKIASLPKEVRDGVNTRLRDGVKYREIIAWLDSAGHPGINEQNVTAWFQGGHIDWLQDLARLDDMRWKREFALEVVKQNEGSQLHAASLQLATSQLYEVISEFDTDGLKARLAENPAEFNDVVKSLAALSKGALELEKFQEHVRTQKEAIARELKQANESGGISPETRERIERELRLL